jgi:hypothetical protein
MAVIDEAMLGPSSDAILDKAGVEGGDLARDGCVTDLVARRDTGVERDTKVLHGYPSGTADEERARPSWRKGFLCSKVRKATRSCQGRAETRRLRWFVPLHFLVRFQGGF